MNILFRADSSSYIGAGHIMRDLVLASQYKKEKIIFATQNLEGNINYKIKELGYEVNILKSNNIEELNKLIKKLNIDLLIIDHYQINFNFEKKLKEQNPKLKIFSFDDTYEKHYCDILLNHNIYADKKKYKDLVPKHCELKCGSKYTLLRDEFIQVKKRLQRKKISKTKTFFIAMGGADHSNVNIDILEVIKKFKNIKVNIVTTTANKNLKQLKLYCKNKNWINLYINSNDIAKILSKSNFAISSPSVMLNEVFYMQIPFIAIKTADNQKYMYEYLKQKNFMVLKQMNALRLKVNLYNLIKRIKLG